METSLADLLKNGGFVMWPLLLFSILAWAVIFERAYTYLTLRPKLQHLAESLLQSLKLGDSNSARQICHTQKPHISDFFVGTLNTDNSRDLAERITERSRLRMMAHFKKHLWILGTIGSSAPFIGLLGTVIGIVRAFNDMAEKGAGGFNVVAAGISEALIATAAGLIVAIISLLTYNLFVNVANQTMNSLKLTLEEILDYTFGPRKSSA